MSGDPANRVIDKLGAPVPVSIIFFQNGLTAVFDVWGKQIGKYQDRHATSIATLKADGYDWRSLDILGAPHRVWDDEK